ncbi:hypothetical protein DL93DRAFT_2120092 [Clavulina sp. PMI_390]|nr:hypothetical protein DL93DRAFT_2120092 [Clavulina sp. PMI_390]
MSSDLQTPTASTKFPHTRACLAALGREHGLHAKSGSTGAKPSSDTSDSEPDSDGRDGDVAGTEALTAQVIQLLDDDDEEGVKDLLKTFYGIQDEATLEQTVLELMHKRTDDLANVPFLFLTPIKRPSRPTSRNSFHSYRGSRPGTPVFAPSSPLAQTFRRPSTPLANPGTIGAGYPSSSPSSSPVPAHATAQPPIGSNTSPSSSPRFLNAKATEFRPNLARSLSSSSIARTHSPSPGAPELWAHNHIPSPTLSSASLGVGRGSSNLAIAAPLLPDRSYSPSQALSDMGDDGPLELGAIGTRTPPILIRHGPDGGIPNGRVARPFDDEDDEDPFSPFVIKKLAPTVQDAYTSVGRMQPADEGQWSDQSSPPSNSNAYDVSLPPHMARSYSNMSDGEYFSDAGNPNLQRHMRPSFFARTDSNTSLPGVSMGNAPMNMSDAAADVVFAEQDMTPFEVLSSVFGSSVSPTLLEEALQNSGYDFDSAMAWLVDQALPPPPPGLLQHSMPSVQQRGGVMAVGRENTYSAGRLGNNPNGRNNGRFGAAPKNVGNRVCRYFLQGECRRSDCRFSHDIDRALCRFWLRGQCAKGENCEFLHNLPQNIDVQGMSSAMSHMDLQDDPFESDRVARNDFPTLGQIDRGNGRKHMAPDPTRTRWANAVKKAPAPAAKISQDASGVVRPANGLSRQSPRIRLRPPSLLPTLPTGESISKLYMAYRAKALELGAARNACLSKAAEAWRRGDGAAAKRHSREAHDLNTKMGMETGQAAAKLVRERAHVAVEAVRARDPNWSDDPRDRIERGQIRGNKLGVCLGVARTAVGSEKRLTPEERTECMLDLHGLHSGEAVEVVEDFLVALEFERFFGLAYLLIGEEKHTGTQDPARGSSRARLAAGVRDWLVKWGYPWLERDGVICVDPLTHSNVPTA